ncbi:MAG TPA: hypothetical protein VGH27_03905 [Streptosporangiaceae bacterium]
MKKSAAVPMDTFFDIFLSHSYEDARVIEGVKTLIETTERLAVYVDWIQDAQMDRSQVTESTAQLLRQRMGHCKFLLYVSSEASPNSKWMPWELGYFDGLKGGKVGILPLVRSEGERFHGQEYLRLYPSYELSGFTRTGQYLGQRFGRRTSPTEGEMLWDAVRRSS